MLKSITRRLKSNHGEAGQTFHGRSLLSWMMNLVKNNGSFSALHEVRRGQQLFFIVTIDVEVLYIWSIW
ncbi:hypothetical protein Dimus_005204 [Dionaea muscipula]